MSETDTLDPQAEDTLSPDVEIDTGTEEEINNPDVDIDSGEVEEESIDDVPESGNWYDNLDPDYRNDPNVTKYKSLAEYVKGNRELVKMLGKDKLVVPSKNATKEELDKFYNKLGRPETADAYSVPDVDIPDSIITQDGSREAFKAKAHELGLTDKQFSELYKMNAEMTTARFNQEVEKANQMAKTTETKLRSEFGAAYEAKIDGAQKVINKFFAGQEMHPAFAALSNDTGFVRAMANIAESLSEDVIAGEARMTKTPNEAQKEWDAIVSGSHEMSKAYFDDLNPEHGTTVDYVMGLQKMISAGGA